jgi:GWxTD domain-containing protein
MPRTRVNRALIPLIAISLFVPASVLSAQSSGNGAHKSGPVQNSNAKLPNSQDQQYPDLLKRPLTEKERKKQAKELKGELRSTYRKWLDQDVRWIITPEEREAFLNLSNDEERDKFIEAFWARRNPDPESPVNTFKEEHYRRMAYANEHFSSSRPGYLTDRGRIYIMYGPPDELQAHDAGGMYNRSITEGGGTTSTYPFEDWWYRHIDGVGNNVKIEFVDQCGCGDFQITMNPEDKDALLHVPGAGMTLAEQMGQETRAQRVLNGGIGVRGPAENEFDTLEQYAKLMQPPKIKFHDLEEAVTSTIHYQQMPFDMRADFVRVTDDTDLVPITIQIHNKDITFRTQNGVATGRVNIFGRVTSIGGEVVQTFEDTIQQQQPADLMPRLMQGASVYWKALPLKPGRYKLDLALKDVNGDRVGTLTKALLVPEFGDDQLSSSSLILADEMEKVPAKLVGGAPFVIGSLKVRPRVAPADGQPAVFGRNQSVNVWMQVYNLDVDQQTKKPNAIFDYSIVNVATNESVATAADSTQQMKNPGEQVTLEKTLPLATLPPGVYRVTITVNDQVAKRTIAPTATFAVQ